MKALAALLLIAAGAAGAQALQAREMRHEGPCDASAGVVPGGRHLIVADDEHNKLGICQRGQPRGGWARWTWRR